MGHNKLRRIFKPTEEEREDDIKRYLRIHDELKTERGCSTCANCATVRRIPGVATGEECECKAGLECDTVFFTVKNCPVWEEMVYVIGGHA